MRSCFLFFLLLAGTVSAQTADFSHYQRLVCQGPIPADFITPSTQLYQQAKTGIDRNSRHKDRKTQDEFYLESSFSLGRLLQSGRVLFGDTVTRYLNRIKNEVLKDQPGLRDSLRVYTLRDDEANAFTDNSGIIVVTTGLVAQCENEAELAFVLCHESIHFKKKHGLKIYSEEQKIKNESGIYSNLGGDQLEESAFRYDQSMETEADLEGLKLYLHSGYTLKALESVFNVMLYSYLPFDDIKFSNRFFEGDGYHFPASYTLDSVKEITGPDDYDDSHSTHPNIKKRREAVLNLAQGLSDEGKKNFLVSEPSFWYLQKICRYEGCLLNLHRGHYETAIYEAYLLLQADSDNFFLRKTIAQALYSISYEKAFTGGKRLYEDYRKMEGQQQQVYYLLYELNATEMNVLALRYAWTLHRSHPEDLSLRDMCHRLFNDLTQEQEKRPGDFISFDSSALTRQDTMQKTDPDADVASHNNLSKYDKIKFKKAAASKRIPDNTNYYQLAFSSLLKDDSFHLAFEAAVQYAEHFEALKDRYKKERTLIKKKGYALGQNKTLVVNPVYIKIDARDDNPVQLMASEKAEYHLLDKIDEDAGKAGVTLQTLQPDMLSSQETDRFNDLATLNDFMDESAEYSFDNRLNSSYEAVQTLSKKYGVTDITWLGVLTRHNKSNFKPGYFCLSIIYPLIPIIIYEAVKANRETFLFTVVVNTNSGAVDMKYMNIVKRGDKNAVLHSNLYYIFKQLNTKRPPAHD